MKLINKIGQMLGLFTSVFIVFSVFLSYISLDIYEYSIFSMSLFEYNRTAAIVIIALAALSFIMAYAQKGFLVSLFGIIIFVVNIFFFNNINTGMKKLDETMYVIKSIFGEIFTPGFGFIFISGGSIVLFFSGLLLNKEKDEKDEDKKISKKVIVAIFAVLASVLLIAGCVACFVYPGFLRKVHTVNDERTGKTFEVIGGKVQAYLPVKVTCTSDDSKEDNWSIEAKYNNDARLIEKEEKREDNSGKEKTQKSTYTYNIDGRISHIYKNTNDVSGSNLTADWSFEYADDYVKGVSIKYSPSKIYNSTTIDSIEYIYDSNGLVSKDNWNEIDEDNFGFNHRENYWYEYDQDGFLKSIDCNQDDSYKVDIDYENGNIHEMVLEGEQSEQYRYKDISFTRSDDHISRIDSNSTKAGYSAVSSDVFTYDHNGVDKIEYKVDYDVTPDKKETAHSNVDIRYEDKVIKEISVIDNVFNGSLDANYSYENGEVSEVDCLVSSNIGTSHKNIKIEYELYQIDLDDWNDVYRDYYYAYRYNILSEPLSLYVYTGDLNFYSYFDGFFDQYNEYKYFIGIKEDGIFEWLTLSKVIGREYYKKEN